MEITKKKTPIWAICLLVVIVIAIIAEIAAIIIINNQSATSDETVTEETTKIENPVSVTTSDGATISSGTYSVKIGNETVSYSAAYLVDGIEATIDGGEYSSTTDDQNVFLVVNGGKLTIKNATISKSGSEDFSGRGDAYSFYGTNSAVVVVGEGSEVSLENVEINTTVSGANAVVATNSGSATVNNSTISTAKDNSRGLHATYEGVITADSTTISTQGGSCASLATDRGEGTVTASNMTLSTAGSGSPLIYSTGNITVKNSTGTATGAQIIVVEGKNSVTVEDSDLSAYGIGNRNGVDNAGIMIYQSMSGDAGEGTGSLVAKNSKFTILSDSSVYDSTPFFFVTNTAATIDLDSVEISFSEDANFLTAAGTDEWGKSGSNGGTVTYSGSDVTATNLNVSADDISSVNGL